MWTSFVKNMTQHKSEKLGQKFNIEFCYFPNGCSFSSILVQKMFKSDSAFLRYGYFIDSVTTNG